MNQFQQLWWEQAHSDHKIFSILRNASVPECYPLHFLQMTTEKLSKAYFFRLSSPTKKTHSAFRNFLLRLGDVPESHRNRVALLFRFGRFDGFQTWLKDNVTLAYQLQNLAPALAGDGPNPEYPWPHAAPFEVPARFKFPFWSCLRDTAKGRRFLQFINIAVETFPEYCRVDR